MARESVPGPVSAVNRAGLPTARELGASCSARHRDMVVWSFEDERSAVLYANISGGMLVRGLMRGAVMVAELEPTTQGETR